MALFLCCGLVIARNHILFLGRYTACNEKNATKRSYFTILLREMLEELVLRNHSLKGGLDF